MLNFQIWLLYYLNAQGKSLSTVNAVVREAMNREQYKYNVYIRYSVGAGFIQGYLWILFDGSVLVI